MAKIKNFKKFMALILMVTLVAAMLSGCNGNTAATSSGSGEVTEKEPPVLTDSSEASSEEDAGEETETVAPAASGDVIDPAVFMEEFSVYNPDPSPRTLAQVESVNPDDYWESDGVFNLRAYCFALGYDVWDVDGAKYHYFHTTSPVTGKIVHATVPSDEDYVEITVYVIEEEMMYTRSIGGGGDPEKVTIKFYGGDVPPRECDKRVFDAAIILLKWAVTTNDYSSVPAPGFDEQPLTAPQKPEWLDVHPYF